MRLLPAIGFLAIFIASVGLTVDSIQKGERQTWIYGVSAIALLIFLLHAVLPSVLAPGK